LANLIPEDKVTEIRNAADIVDVISDSVVLKQRGKNFVGLCPFHSEKTPSFTVNSEKQIFYCFGCGTGGNVFTFMMKYGGMTFPEAARSLAGRFGIELPRKRMTPQQKKAYSEREQLYAVNQRAAAFFSRTLADPRGGTLRGATFATVTLRLKWSSALPSGTPRTGGTA
jgi:DNA primase